MFKKIVISVVSCLLSISVFASDKTILSQVETMTVAKSGLRYHARIDTGAGKTSLHAVDLTIIGGAFKKMKSNVGKIVEFTTENERGEKKRIQAEIVSTLRVKNSQGIETRYMVKLDVGFSDKLHHIYVNLRDRSHMKYKLLIGRNFLKHNYIVDVSQKSTLVL
ncbi:hypothetical protein CXF80_05625 [Shewanella sp. Actino-trap-3]|jgi:hypothetical protein|uniref:ATP-dependent zinc protease family protein n=1 Tax=Shewanella TaxID=22 RepID=UPI000C34A6DC|nr:RimK/LysX family protein [Shewanella sp. Actino-trap-3]PKG77836.1 hypothetical protein CXF80_05625 [Shewanella sp. Actino-trap-3]|tara:strand:+ start:30395 stop:30886 length:492 start_codon:yes stop_codon:yes gene_type:complete